MGIDHDSYVKQIYKEGKETNFVYNSNEHPPFSPLEMVESIFNLTTLGLFVGFLAIYFILYNVLSSTLNKNNSNDVIKSHTINLTVVLLLLIGSIYFYLTLSNENQSHLFTHVMALFKDEMNNPNTIVVMTIFFLLFYIFVYVMNFPMGKETKPFSLEIIEFKSWVYLAMLFFIVLIIYGFHFEIVDWTYYEMYKYLIKPIRGDDDKKEDHDKKEKTTPSVADKIGKTTPSVADKNEVFNIGNNLYTYEDAQSICTAYGARLATYDDIEQAYEAGGEWCNYGWSENQMIFFPTQKDTWQKLQKDPKKKNNCGRPGINGGYMENPYVKFGVNCYGVKPKPKTSDLILKTQSVTSTVASPPPAIDPNVQKWKSLLNTLSINYYNSNEWSEFDSIPQVHNPQVIYMNTPVAQCPSISNTPSSVTPSSITPSSITPSGVTPSSITPSRISHSSNTHSMRIR